MRISELLLKLIEKKYYVEKEQIENKLNIFYAMNKISDEEYSSLVLKAEEVYATLAKHFSVEYDVAGQIGKRYRRQDAIGTPFCVTVDFDTMEDNAVTVRNRDTMEQVRLPIDELVAYIQDKIAF